MAHGWVLLFCCFIPQAVILYGSVSIKQHQAASLTDQLVTQNA
jgi:hypothetical protein